MSAPIKIRTLAGATFDADQLKVDASGIPEEINVPLAPATVAAAINQLQQLGPLEPAKSEPTVTTATPIKDATGKWSTWYVPMAASTSLTVEFGPTEAEVGHVKLEYETVASSKQVASFRLPPEWWVELTSTSLGQPVVITG